MNPRAMPSTRCAPLSPAVGTRARRGSSATTLARPPPPFTALHTSRKLHTEHACFQRAARLGAFDHREPHPVLVRTGRVVVFQFHDHVGAGRRCEALQAHDRRTADGTKDGISNHLHMVLCAESTLNIYGQTQDS